MKHILYFFSCVLFVGCPFVYDPPSAAIDILNYSDSAIYIHHGCSETALPCEPELVLFETWGANATDASGIVKPDTLSPSYRIDPFMHGKLLISGSSKKPKLTCENKSITIFIIEERTMREHDWAEICSSQLYSKKMTFTQDELEEMNWSITYRP